MNTNPYLLGLYEKSMPNSLCLSEKLKATGESGYDYMELSIDETDEKLSRLDWSREEISLLQNAIMETGVPVKSICLSGHRRFPLGDPDPAVRQKSLDIMKRAIELASCLGIRIIQLAGYDVYYRNSNNETKLFFTENLLKSVSMAAREGIILAFETMETPFIDTTEKAIYWISQISSPYLQIYPDTGNLTNASLIYGTAVKDDLEKGAGHIVALHLKESKPGVYREICYGQGHVNFSEAIQAAWQLGVRLYVAEFWHIAEGASSNGNLWRDTLKENNRFLRNFFEKTVFKLHEPLNINTRSG